MVTTQMAAAAGVLGWLLVEWKHVGKPTSLGAASGALAGLVAITPAAGFVDIWASLVIGLVGGIVCYVGVLCKNRLDTTTRLMLWASTAWVAHGGRWPRASSQCPR